MQTETHETQIVEPAQTAETVETVENTDSAPEQVEEKKAEQPQWAQRRIDRLTSYKYKLEAENQLLKKQLEEKQPERTEEPKINQEELVKQIEQQAQIKIALKVAQKETPDLPKAIEQLQKLDVLPDDYLREVLDSDTPGKLMKYLAENLDEADELFTSTPIKFARKLSQIEAKLATSKPHISKTPEPIKPITAKTASSNSLNDSDDVATWMAKRREQLRKT